VRAGVVVGFLGAYTTFSTFGQETRDLLVEGHRLLAVTNVLASDVAASPRWSPAPPSVGRSSAR
jgi:fluoride ion exporter CrcB/FEX